MPVSDETLPPQKPFPSATTDPPSRVSVGTIGDDPGEETFSTIGPYRVVEKLGSGGMGVVYKCDDPGLKRFVAVKVLRKKYSNDESYQRRFRREAQTIASLSHASIAHIYGIGEVGSPTGPLLYIVMEQVDGPSIEKLLATEKKLAVDHATALARDTALGLKAAFAKGIVHRDIKPSNLIVSSSGTLKIVDFGLAKELRAESSLTDEGIVMGTPHYISPEQGRGRPVDHRSDIYSLGATFYHMLTGRPPFEGSSQVSVIVSHVNDTPVAPHEVEPSVPEAVSSVALKMMAKSVDDRYQTYDEIVADLEQLLMGGAPTSSQLRRAETQPIEPSPLRRSRGWALATAGLVVLIAATLAVILAPAPPAIDAARREACAGWLKDRDDGGVILTMDFSSPPPERAGRETWRSLLVPLESPPNAESRPQLQTNALRWDSFEQPIACGFRFSAIDEVQVGVGIGSGTCDIGFAIVDATAPTRRRLLVRLRPSEETLEPLVAERGSERALPSAGRLAPVPRLLGQGAFVVFLELKPSPVGTLVSLRIDRKKDRSQHYQGQCELEGSDWRQGVLVLQMQSPVKPFSASLDRVVISGKVARPAGVEDLSWRS